MRELEAVIDRATLLARGGQLGARHLAFATPAEGSPPPPPPRTSAPVPATARVVAGPADGDIAFLRVDEREDRARIIAALEACNGNQTRAAKQLGIARTTLVNKLRLYRIPRPRS